MAKQVRECYADCFRQNRNRRSLAERSVRPICETCKSCATTEMHHNTYRHEGHELSRDLDAVCRTCHKEIEKLKDFPRQDSGGLVAALRKYHEGNPIPLDRFWLHKVINEDERWQKACKFQENQTEKMRKFRPN